MAEMIDIKFLKLENPGEFWAKEIKSTHMSREAADFEKLSKEINDHFSSDDHAWGRVQNPHPGQICIGRSRKDHMWYRVRIQHVMQSSQGRTATCFLLDHAETCQVHTTSMREADEMFLRLPYQAKRFVLHGIQPVTMVTDWVNMCTSMKPANTWDVSARDYISDMYKQAVVMQAELMLKDKWGRIHIRLYVTLKDQARFCVNDHLVEKDFATLGEPLCGETLPLREAEKVFLRSMTDSPSSSDDTQTERRGRPNPCNAKDKMSSPKSNAQSMNSSKSHFPSSPTAAVSSPRNSAENNPPQPSVPPKGAGRAALMMSLISKEKKPGSTSPHNISNSRSPPGRADTRTQAPMGVHTSRGRGQQLQTIQTHILLSSPGRADSGDVSTKEQRSEPQLENSTESPRSHQPMGRGQKLLNFLPNVATERRVGGINQDCSQSTNQQLNIAATLFSEAMKEFVSDRLGSLSDSQEEGVSFPKRPRTPNNVRFSDADEILLPRQDSTSPPTDVEPSRSILKKSPSSDHNVSMEYCSEPSGSRCGERTSAEEDPPRSDITRDIFRPSVSRPANDLLQQLQTVRMEEERPTHGQDSVSPDSENVLYMGPTKARAILRLDEVPFGNWIRRMLSDDTRPNKLATFAWTPIQRGLDLAAVALKNDWTRLTYVFPLVYQLQQVENYKELPRGGGPKVLILASSWKKARLVYDWCREAASAASREIRVKVIFGGGEDLEVQLSIPYKGQELSLVNGCEILVATPHCLLRMLQAECTSLKRVCHLVLEDADILTEEFTKQVKEIMELYQKTSQRQRSAPKQLLSFSQRWTPSLTAFTRIYMNSPTVIITSRIEAAMFGRIKLIPVSCGYDDRMDRLLKILDPSIGDHTGKTIIFSSDKDALGLYEMLSCGAHFAMLACSGLTDTALNDVKRKWNSSHNPNSQIILILTDEAMSEILHDITDAQTVIHYQSAGFRTTRGVSKWLMGTRMWTMRKGFVNPVADKKVVSKCRSYLFLTDRIGEEAHHLVMLLQRLYIKVPEILMQRAEYFMKKVKKGEANELCKFMKAFGKCRDEKKCSMRHMVFSSLDSPGVSTLYQKLPQHGEVKVYITHGDDSTCFYGRLLEHTVNGKTTTLNHSYVGLMTRMNLWFGVASRRQKCNVPQQGKLYAIEDAQHMFHRVETRDLSSVGHRGISEKAIVYYVDMGKVDKISTEHLYELPEDLAKIQFQAVEIFACRVKPIDNDVDWTGQANAFMSELVYNKTLDGTILLSMVNTLWLDPLVERERLQQVNIISTKHNVRAELQKNGYGQENNQHLYLLYSACRDRLSLPDEIYNPEHSATKAYTVFGRPMDMAVESLPVQPASTENDSIESWVSEFIEVYVSAVSSPDLIYLQLANKQPLWLELQDDLDTCVRLTDPQPIEEIKKGTLVMAKFPLEVDKWYRGKVMDVRSSQVPMEAAQNGLTVEKMEVDIFFLDTGEQEWVSQDDIQPLNTRYLQLPFQAIEAIVMHLIPKGDSWPETVSDFIWDFTRTEEEEPVPKKLFAKVVCCGQARHSGSHHYGVELYDTSKMYNINLAFHLVAEGMADFTSEYKQELFAVPETEDCYSKLATVCQVIAHVDVNNPHLQQGDTLNQDVSTRVALCKQLLETVAENTSHVEVAGHQQVVSWLSMLLMFVWDEVVVDTVCTALTMLVNATEDNLISVENRLDVTCELLDFTVSPVIQKAVLGLWSTLLRDVHCRQTLLTKGSARILSNILSSSQDSQVVGECVDTMLLLVTSLPTDQGMLRLISKSGLISSVCGYLSKTGYSYEEGYHLNISTQCVHILGTLARYPTLRDTLRKQGAVKELCGLLGDPDTEAPLVEVCVSTLDRLSSNNRYNKDLMNTYNMISVCARLSQDGRLSKDVCDLCHSLQGRLESVKKSSHSSPPRKAVGSGSSAAQGLHCNGAATGTMSHLVQGLRVIHPQIPVRQAKPDIIWSQDKWNVLLRVQVKDVPEEVSVACFLPHSVKFRAVQEDTEFTFELVLYELVMPDDCEVGVCSAEVRLGLRKSSKGRWPRLTKEKLKLPYIKVDFDRFIDSSDSETEDEDSPIDSPLNLVQRNVQRQFPFYPEGVVNKRVREDFNPELLETNSNSESDSGDEELPHCYDEHDTENFRI